MTTKINLFKILTAVSFLLVLVTGEKLSFFVGIYLLIGIFNPNEVNESLYAYLIAAFTLYLFISGSVRKKSKFDDIICAIGIIAMQILIFLMLNFKFMGVVDILFLLPFIFLSFTTLWLIIYRKIKLLT
ncbi:hypothetical protein [Emticicia sp. 21SJ11W-3]|uniref:hypothetical protein n=1 Tax=Emticicia sp. 21SJ11W-3 TaxID=2916755 RepID=UPI0020A03102|nr:hypothetical protein [Emticicia sp. 21SJ11W-3]UTA70230.1 hypothetical protein MB380_10485 [Emticicia sp. 21SJ11W-3]